MKRQLSGVDTGLWGFPEDMHCYHMKDLAKLFGLPHVVENQVGKKMFLKTKDCLAKESINFEVKKLHDDSTYIPCL